MTQAVGGQVTLCLEGGTHVEHVGLLYEGESPAGAGEGGLVGVGVASRTSDSRASSRSSSLLPLPQEWGYHPPLG